MPTALEVCDHREPLCQRSQTVGADEDRRSRFGREHVGEGVAVIDAVEQVVDVWHEPCDQVRVEVPARAALEFRADGGTSGAAVDDHSTFADVHDPRG